MNLNENLEKELKIKSYIITFLIILLTGLIYLTFSLVPFDQLSKQSTGIISSNVEYADGAFTISNLNDYGWSNLRLELNSSYTFRIGGVPAKQSITIGALQFSNSKGERFNPFSMKPMHISISCDTPDGRGHGFYEWH